MRPIVTPEEMIDSRDLLKVVFTDFRARYNRVAEEKAGIIQPEDFDRLIIDTIKDLPANQKDISEGFMEFVIGFMFANSNNSVEAFKAIEIMFGW
jgi:hypothetical protein